MSSDQQQEQDQASTGGRSDGSVVSTKLSRRWLIKMGLTTLALLAFGGWALADLAYLYPARGEAYAEAQQLEYLRAADSARSLFEASVEDPAAELSRLKDRASTGASLTEVEQARLAWLEALAVPGLGLLRPEVTSMEAPRETLVDLEERLASAEQPKKLSAFDIPSQWLIMIVCWGISAYLLVLWARVASKKYTWDASAMRLSLPGGASLVPGDLEDVDKRKWHKFYVTLEVNDTHDTIAGEHVPLDLYRYVPLEEWVLTMEKAAFPDRQEEDGEEEDPQDTDRKPDEEDSGVSAKASDAGADEQAV